MISVLKMCILINQMIQLITITCIMYHSTSKMKLVDVQRSMYIDFNKQNKSETANFEVSDIVRISKYKNYFSKGYVQSWSEEDFGITQATNTVLRTFAISDLKGERVVGKFYKKNLQKTNQKEFRI